jgi:peptidoglycan hydrolase-like protein with peptidoglycan-binding domain
MIRALSQKHVLVDQRASARLTKRRTHMKKILSIFLSLLFVSAMAIAAQNTNSSTTANNSNSATKPKTPRKPIFRANKDQIKQAQKILKDRSFYAGEETGKLDADTRAGMKKYQAAESLKVTGTLNKVTLVKMGVALTDKQKAL